MLTVLGWLWQSETCLAKYRISHANLWAKMIHRHLDMPHRFVVLTDKPVSTWNEFDPIIKPVQLWQDCRDMKIPTWPAKKPHCWVRLKAFGTEAKEIIGDRFVSIDLDCLVLGQLDPLFDRPEEFVIYKHPSMRHSNPYQGSMWMMTAGARRQVWDDFRGEESALEAAAAGFVGSDQAWICRKLGPGEAIWGTQDGVYSWAAHVRADPALYADRPPADARIIFFQGCEKAWDGFEKRPQFNWVAEAYQ